MIWFFLAGFISGAVGMMLYAGWWVRTHAVPIAITEEELEKLADEKGDIENENVRGDSEEREISEPVRNDDGDDGLGRSPEQRVDDAQSDGSNAEGR